MPLLASLPPDAASRTYGRLFPRLQAHYKKYSQDSAGDWALFCTQLADNFDNLFTSLVQVYSDQYDFYYQLETLLETLADSWIERSDALKELDFTRQKDPYWFESNRLVGGMCYVDLFAKNLKGLQGKIGYFNELGLTYLHLMPLFQSPAGENDGGYAISSYRDIDPKIGSMPGLSSLAEELRKNGISLVLDFVFNHTSQEHAWALKARSGDPIFQNYYYMFPDREKPDAYGLTLREIFPDEHPGAFTWFPKFKRWIWTTFHSYQWDLNYSNPEVFIAMAKEMLALANAGVEVLRLDALAFIWKELGTSCENLPQAHLLIQAFNACARISAPTLLFKSEAIVHPDEVARYIKPDECQISYNPLLMALIWESLATRSIKLLLASMRENFAISSECTWVNYIRCHDDIGWTFSDETANLLGMNGYDHRRFLNDFYTGRFKGSFALGLPFQENLKTGDCRISGSSASLAGLEQALLENSEKEIQLALKRIMLIHALILTIGGIPLIYLGDEIATLNDYSYREDNHKVDDSRWVHRPAFDWLRAADRLKDGNLVAQVFNGLANMISIRKNNEAFCGHQTDFLDTGNEAVFGFLRTHLTSRVLVLSNFSEREQPISANLLRLSGLSYKFIDLMTGKAFPLVDFKMAAYQFICLLAK